MLIYKLKKGKKREVWGNAPPLQTVFGMEYLDLIVEVFHYFPWGHV
jgi:hypothetical protein